MTMTRRDFLKQAAVVQAALPVVGQARAAAPVQTRETLHAQPVRVGMTDWNLGQRGDIAKIALARMGHPRAVAEILRDLESSRREVLSAAVVAAGRAGLTAARERIRARQDDVADRELVDDALARLA